MCHISLVEVVNAKHDLLPQELGLNLGHLSVGLSFEVAVERSPVNVFHDQKHLLMTFERLKQLC